MRSQHRFTNRCARPGGGAAGIRAAHPPDDAFGPAASGSRETELSRLPPPRAGADAAGGETIPASGLRARRPAWPPISSAASAASTPPSAGHRTSWQRILKNRADPAAGQGWRRGHSQLVQQEGVNIDGLLDGLAHQIGAPAWPAPRSCAGSGARCVRSCKIAVIRVHRVIAVVVLGGEHQHRRIRLRLYMVVGQ